MGEARSKSRVRGLTIRRLLFYLAWIQKYREPRIQEARTAGVVVLGRGRLGSSLTAALEASGLEVLNVSARDRVAVSECVPGARLVVLSVPDEAIERSASELSQSVAGTTTAFVHTSGALGLEQLAALAARGNPVGSFHPFQPFPTARPPSAFRGCTIAVEASDPALRRLLMNMAKWIGARAKVVADEDRALYHAAAVTSSTYVVTLVAQAQAMLQAIGWPADDAFEALLPLVSGTLENLAAKGIPEALSGPLRRGDVDTIARHVAALDRLESGSELRVGTTYRELAIAAMQLALRIGLDPAAATRVEGLLASQTPRPVHSGGDR